MEIQPYQQGNEQEILKLFQLSFGKPISMEYWRWRFLNNPFHSQPHIHLMWENNLLVGHYAVSPTNFLLNGKNTLGALSMTTMTHPDYGGKGIFSTLAESLYKQLAENGFAFVWGFPNSNSHYGFIKNLGWKDIGIVPMLSLNTDNFKVANNLNYTVLTNFDDDIANLLQDQTPVAINKSSEYLQWRYIQNPSFHYKIIQTQSNITAVYKKIVSFRNNAEFEIDIVEVSSEIDKDSLYELLSAIIQEEGKILQFNIWVSFHQKKYLAFEKMGFKQNLPLTYLGFRNFTNNNEVLSDYRNWNLCMGYSDVF